MSEALLLTRKTDLQETPDLPPARKAEWQASAKSKPQVPAAIVCPEPRSESKPKTWKKLTVDVFKDSQHTFWSDLSGDIRAGGLFVATLEDLPVGTPIDLTLRLDTMPPVQIICEVGWVREHNQFTADMEPGVGLRFGDISEQLLSAIEKFMQLNPTLLHEMDL